MQGKISLKFFGLMLFVFLLCGLFIYFVLPMMNNQVEYKIDESEAPSVLSDKTKTEQIQTEKEILNTGNQKPISHITTPEKVKAVYISAWVAGSPKIRENIIKMIDETELNAIVIDVKDSTGRVSFDMPIKEIQDEGSIEKRISNIRDLTNLLHEKNIYIIGRISVFQDPYMAKKRPEWAINKKSDGSVWKDRKGLSFLDPSKKEVHDYIIKIAKGAYEEGFDEINFDYIRYPSDGNMKDMDYKLKEGETRADNIENFFKYLSVEMKKEKNIPISGDLFGLTTEVNDDMGIGQVWEKAIKYFDYLSPMVYPSHYPSGHAGYQNSSMYPYEVINRALVGAVNKTKAISENTDKIRPWLQDFDLGATYTKEMVQAQIKAVYDNGLDSWMLWDPSNKYTPEALIVENKN